MGPGSVQVKEGDPVTRDTVLGEVGTTGHSFGAHLHFMAMGAAGAPRTPVVALGHAPKVRVASRRSR